LQSVWKALGGEDTVDEEAIQNLDLLWRALDGLPEDELDLLGPALDASLEELCALPDPEASSEFGVQLMTIHKAKGLEFEVVIVPALEVDGQRGERGMFSWLERGLVDGGNEEATEFLIAPIQTKGGDKGLTKAWVDAVKARRAKDEMRRVLYVAATRAREELHLFSRPRFNVKAATEWSLCTPTGLLATAWAAFGDEIEARFGSWHARRSADAVSRVLDSVAAQGDLLQMPLMFGEDLPTRLRRLPQDYIAPDFRVLGIGRGVGLRNDLDVQDAARSQFTRVEGGLESRLLGTAVHGLLEKLTRLRQDLPLEAATRKLVEQLPTVTSEIRRHGLANAAAQRLASEALAIAQRTGSHAVGAWITAPHADAQSESQWTAWADGAISTMRPDRVFFAGGPDGLPDLAQESWWVIDYKTSRADGRDLSSPANLKEFLSQHREQYRVQLDTYATVLRGLIQKEQEHRPGQFLIRAAIYYPRLRAFDFWEA
jgi:ATP-dependent exoDNAse (exonuclease V) beta subunit